MVASLAFRILAQDDGANKTLSRIGVTAGVTEGKLSLLARSTSRFGETTRTAFKTAGAALLGAGLVEGLKSVWQEAQASNLVTKQTEAVIRSTGGAAHVTADQVGDLATALSQKNAVDDEAVQSGANLLLTFTNIRNEAGRGNDIFNRSTQAVLDMTAAMNGGVVTQENLKSTSIQVGKALNDPLKGLTALQKVGVTFTAQQKEQIRTMVASGDTLGAQKIILQELTKEFGGSAEAAATGAKRLGIVIGNIKEDLGQGLVRVVDTLSNKLVGDLPAAMDAAGRSVHLLTDPLGRIFRDLKELGTTAGSAAMQVVKPLALLAGGAIIGGLNLLAAVLDFIADNSTVFVPLAAGALAFIAASKGIGLVVSLYQGANAVLETLALKALYAKDAMIGLATGETAAKVAGIGVGSAMGALGVVVAGASVAVGILAAKHMSGVQRAQEHANAVTQFSQALRDNSGEINKNVVAQRANALEEAGLLQLAQKIGLSLDDYTQATLGNKDAQDKYRDAVIAAKDAGTLNLGEYAKLKSGTDSYTSATDEAKAANERLATASGQTTSATNSQAEATRRAAAAAAAAKKADDDLWASLTRLANVNLSAASAHLAVQSAVLAVDASLTGLDAKTKAQTRSLDANTAAGVSARQQLVNNIQTILADGEAQKARGKSTEQATATMRSDLATLRQHYLQLGYSKQAVDAIIGSLVDFGKQHPTATVKINDTQAATTIKSVNRSLDLLNGKVVRVFINGEVSTIGSLPGVGRPIASHAGGGVWSGWSWTGEKGPELSYTSPKDTTATFTAQQSKQMVAAFRSGQGGGGVRIDNLNVNVAGVTGRQAALEIAQELKRLERNGFTVST